MPLSLPSHDNVVAFKVVICTYCNLCKTFLFFSNFLKKDLQIGLDEFRQEDE